MYTTHEKSESGKILMAKTGQQSYVHMHNKRHS